ncbi:MAG: hypothetical protein JO170_14065, partial [Verrucomicrobia bacterium]|nr:hypothetical protein [Verrucomicrobiota bacterium]
MKLGSYPSEKGAKRGASRPAAIIVKQPTIPVERLFLFTTILPAERRGIMGMGKQFRSGSDSGEVIRPESLRGPGVSEKTEIGSASAPESGEANRQKPCSNSVNGGPGKAALIGSPEREPLFQIVSRHDFSDVTYLLEVRHPLLARASKPGQFVIVQSHEHGERIPLTIADFDHQKGTITLVIQAVGKTTKEMQRICLEGAR